MKEIFKNFLALLFGLVLVLVILEVFLRLVNPLGLRVLGDKIVLRANVSDEIRNDEFSKLEKVIRHSRNNLGFRGEDKPADLEQKFSVMVIGGSTTECYYLSDGNDWPALLGVELKKVFKNVWLNNAGLNGHTTFGHKILMDDYVLKLKPKVVLFYTGINDVARNDLNDQDKRSLRNEYSDLSKFLRNNLALADYLYHFYRMKVQGFTTVGKEINFAESGNLLLPERVINERLDEIRRDFLPGFERRLQELIDQCRNNRITPIFITQPVLHGFGRDSLTGADLATIKISPDENGKLNWEKVQLYNQKIEEVCQRNKVFVIDVANRMPKRSDYYYDWWHYTNDGSKVVNQLIADTLISHLTTQFPAYRK